MGNHEAAVEVRGKAYPGLRHLDVLRRHEQGAIVASLCSDALDIPDVPIEHPHHGLNPAFNALIEQVGKRLGPH